MKTVKNNSDIENSIFPELASDGLPKTALNREFYTSDKCFDNDMKRVFSRRWIFACHISEVANEGDYMTVELGEISVIVARNQDGGVNAFHNVCRHRGVRLCESGNGNVRFFVCPFHSWSYNLDGSLRAAAKMPDLDKGCYSAKSVWSEIWNGMIFIHMGVDKPKPVSEYLSKADISGHQLENAKVIAVKDYHTKANWKIVGETFQECYHCTAIHGQSLGKIISSDTTYSAYENPNETGDDMEFIIYSDDLRDGSFKPGVQTETRTGQHITKRLLGDESNPQPPRLISWFPNFSVGAWPDFAVIVDWLPISAKETLFRTRWLVHQDAVEGVDYDVDEVTDLTHALNIEDKVIVQRQQQGVNSPVYVPGPYHSPLEDDARKYIAHYISMLKG